MPLKQKKAPSNHALNIGSPRAEKQQQQQQQSVPDSSAFSSPALAPTNYREIHQNEVEALRSIYGDDFEEVENKRSAWHVSYDTLYCNGRSAVVNRRYYCSSRPMFISSFACDLCPILRSTSNCWSSCQRPILKRTQICR